jgi:hypothetical protein
MRASAAIASLVLGVSLTGCGDELPPPAGTDSEHFSPLPPAKTTVSGVVFDPEAFFFALATFPEPPPDEEGPPPDEEGPPPPPPLLAEGIPYLMRSVAAGVRVSLTLDGAAADVSAPAAPNGYWQVPGVLTGDSTYLMRAEPPEEGVVIGAPEMFPSPPFAPIPSGRYFPTTTLRPIVPLAPACMVQVASVVGDAGALSAVANLRTSMGQPTTAADLVDPGQTGGVALIWVSAPSFFFEYFLIPANDIKAEVSGGTLYALDWAPPEAEVPGQSPMGFIATPDDTSPIGYFAVVLPRGSTNPVEVRFIDTVTTSPEEPGGPPRPWAIPEFSAQLSPGVSVSRLYAQPAGPPEEEEEPGGEQHPPPDLSWLCLPIPPEP